MIGKGSCWDQPRVFKLRLVTMRLSCMINLILHKTSLCWVIGSGLHSGGSNNLTIVSGTQGLDKAT